MTLKITSLFKKSFSSYRYVSGTSIDGGGTKSRRGLQYHIGLMLAHGELANLHGL
jgi:hypothetical protein